ncbi:cation channel sperm-associated protein subunit gamma isoform X3 [Octodon degus]|uniref:Cation channel sperm-associated protein subunit gamma isoform X3 n=1 Tax=Octodon degus TaxID=10160 RepID=A0A6P6EYH3_OCTDE|nr:cation channel sperm-associated protein subunit gamma isoform X3 [Octodon degus]
MKERSQGEERSPREGRSWGELRPPGRGKISDQKGRGAEGQTLGEERSWGEEKRFGEQRSQQEERARKEERNRTKERDPYQRSGGADRVPKEKRQGPELAGELLPPKPGSLRADGDLGQGKGWGMGRKPREEQPPGPRPRRRKGKGRGVEKAPGRAPRSVNWSRMQSSDLLQAGTRARRKRPGQRQEKWGREARSERGARCRNKDVIAGCSCMVHFPAMFPISFVWPRVQVLWVFLALLEILLVSSKVRKTGDFQDCTWQVVLNKFDRVGDAHVSDRFYDQEPVDTVGSVFSMLVDSPIDHQEKYLGFPYYLKISYSCEGQPSEDLVRSGHLMGLKPLVLVTFQSSVNFYRWKIEQLQIRMEAAPFRYPGTCLAEEVCAMSWFMPMPIQNGSVVVKVEVTSNGLGPFIPNKRFHVNINGFLKKKQGRIEFTVGSELFDLAPQYFINVSSRPLWYTLDQSPVLILGGIPNEKAILLSDTNFETFSLVELSIDSCWVGSFYCPQADFSATIYDAVSTESTLFIRQNQLVYYFTGTYATLFNRSHSSGSWVRVLATECIKRLCPVLFHSNGSEYIMALTTGKHEGYMHFGTITEGRVSFEMLPKGRSVCEQISVGNCSIMWAEFLSDEYTILLLVEIQDLKAKSFCVVRYRLISDDMEVLYIIPNFIPDARGLEFLMMVGTEKYTNSPMVPKGMFFNTYNNVLIIWGNFLLQRSHMVLTFTNQCPFTMLSLLNLPNPQAYTREECYRARPPHILESSGFHSKKSLAVYQGLLYYLLWLHSKYNKPYADPVHDPTWRWWKNKKQDQDYYLYLKRNWLSAGGIHIDMASYEKVYDLKSQYQLPQYIFLDKGNSYQFSLKMRSKEGSAFQAQRKLAVGFLLADPHCLEAFAKQEAAVIRNSVQFLITLRDKKVCYDQGISGHHLMKTSVMVKVRGSSGHCFQSTHFGLRMQGNLMLPVFIGCPPGKRLAFDITYTLEHSRLLNKQYFDCVHPDPEMPCFLFRDQFHPFFLVQDLVTGDSGSFMGRYMLKVVGGGPTLDSIRDYSEEEIYRFNSPLDTTNSRIWTTETIETTEDGAFHIMSSQSFGIQWLCLENSPCYDTTPQSIFSPEFYFKVLVSNRGVDSSTYCDYQLNFLLHIHGLPLSFRRALSIALVSASVFVGLVILYITFCLLWPLMVKAWNNFLWKMNTVITSGSLYYSTSSSSSSQMSSNASLKGTSKVTLKEDKGDKADAEEAVAKELPS